MIASALRLTLLFLAMVVSSRAYSADPCVAYCVSVSDRPALYTRDTHEILRAYAVTGATPQELVDQCPDYALGRTMLLIYYRPVRLQISLIPLPGDFLKMSEAVVATESNACTAPANRPLKP